MEVDVEEDEARLDPEDVERGHPDRDHALPAAHLPDGVPDPDRARGRDPDLEPEVTGVAGAGQEHLDARDRRPDHVEVAEGLRLRRELPDEVARPRALD